MPRGIVKQVPFLAGGEILLNPGFGLAPAPQHTHGRVSMASIVSNLDGRLGYLNQGAGTRC